MKEQRYRDPKAVHAWNNGEGGRAARKRYAERNKEAIRARLAARVEDVALAVEQERESNAKSMESYRQLKALLKSLQGEGE
ncbi:TPA: hypothetical protein NH836_002929 [Pseudomonas aeruginosa]|nr:hypothetical protein [Pseudomonas aeruginosa]